MQNNVRKWILIPEFRPLWAMRECFGPAHGPLEKPCPTTLDIIGKLLRQKGNDKLTIMEVKDPKTGPSTPVQLTLNNYTLPYEEILKGVTVPKASTSEIAPPVKEPISPTVEDTSDKKVAENIADLLNKPTEPAAPVENTVDPAADHKVKPSTPTIVPPIKPEETSKTEGPTPAAEEPKADAQDAPAENNEAEDDGEEEKASANDSQYAGMTKAERRAARKAAAAEAAKQNN